MTIRDISSKVSTANYATYTIRRFGNANDIGCILDCEVHFK